MADKYAYVRPMSSRRWLLRGAAIGGAVGAIPGLLMAAAEDEIERGLFGEPPSTRIVIFMVILGIAIVAGAFLGALIAGLVWQIKRQTRRSRPRP